MGASFKIYVRCHSCKKDYDKTLAPPSVEGAPCDIDELLESEYLRNQKFKCSECECPIATITGVKELEWAD